MPKATLFNADLIDDLAKRKAVLFIGAGASKWAKPTSGGSFKGWSEFLDAATKKVQSQSIKKLIRSRLVVGDFLIASELLKKNLGEEWPRLLSQEFQQAAATSRLHDALIKLGQRVVITTNFDKLLETAWADSQPGRYPTVISKMDEKVFRLFRDDDPYLIKLHGSIDEPEEIVFDKTSYQRTAYANQFYRDLIGTLLLTHTFIFIGFSMEDPAISLVVESHAFRFSSTRPHYIFMPGKAVPELDDMSKTLRKLFVLRYKEENQHVALAEALEDLYSQIVERRRLLGIQ